jgi:HD-GYP domain-containing protein (c-di-GMP phosphodiesterase class II)
VADAYDAMTSDRPYRKAVSHISAVTEIECQSGSQFDPKVVDAFLRAERQGLIRDRAGSDDQSEEAVVVNLVAQAAKGEEDRA